VPQKTVKYLGVSIYFTIIMLKVSEPHREGFLEKN